MIRFGPAGNINFNSQLLTLNSSIAADDLSSYQILWKEVQS